MSTHTTKPTTMTSAKLLSMIRDQTRQVLATVDRVDAIARKAGIKPKTGEVSN